MKTPFVAVLMGSDSDLKTVQNTLDTLDLMDISWEVRITSAHRTPQDTHRYVEDATERIPNGALIEVDGNAGTVRVLELP